MNNGLRISDVRDEESAPGDKPNFFLPEEWSDGKRMVESLNDVKSNEFSLRPTSAAERVQAEYNQMFYVGFLYGMAMEATKDRRLEERYVNPEL